MNFTVEENRIYQKSGDGKLIAEVTFPAITEKVVNINHTYVDESLRGQGVAGQLMTAAADKLRSENKKACATCSYAVKWFESHPDYQDVFTKSPEI